MGPDTRGHELGELAVLSINLFLTCRGMLFGFIQISIAAYLYVMIYRI